MAIQFDCLGCGRTYRVDDAYAGKKTKCKICDAILTVPTVRTAARPPLMSFGGTAAPPSRALSTPVPPPASRPASDLYDLGDEEEAVSAVIEDVEDEPRQLSSPRRPGGAAKKKSRVEYGGFLRRTGAIFVDWLLVSLVLITVNFSIAFAYGFYIAASEHRPATKEDVRTAVIVCYVIDVVLILIYSIGMVASSYQGTVGKYAMWLKVYTSDGDRLSIARAFLRELARLLSALTVVGYIMAAFTEKKRSLHDILVGTVVVKD